MAGMSDEEGNRQNGHIFTSRYKSIPYDQRACDEDIRGTFGERSCNKVIHGVQGRHIPHGCDKKLIGHSISRISLEVRPRLDANDTETTE